MSKEHRGEHFSRFRGHTLLKHGVLERYAKAFSYVLRQTHEEIWLVDGFAGRGRDDAGNPGSPLLLAETAAQLDREGCNVRLLAIEKERDHFEALQSNLARFDIEQSGSSPVAYLRHGTLATRADEVFRLVGQSPALVFLDPFGADGLSLNFVRRVLALEKGEVFALFSHVAIHRHLSALRAEYHGDRTRRETAESLFPDWKDEWLERTMEKAEQADASLRPTKEAAERILVDLFGGHEQIRAILGLPPAQWPNEVLRAYMRCLESCGATHITRIAVFDEEQKHSYWLIHAAKNAKAAIKMKEAAYTAINQSELPETSKDWIRYAHAVKIADVVEAVKRRFAGLEVRWNDKAKNTNTIQWFALGQTPMAMDQKRELKEALKSSVPVIRKIPLTFRFPS